MSLGSERRQRAVAKGLVGENLRAEAVPMTFRLKDGGEEIRAVPLVYIPNLQKKVFDLLDENNTYVSILKKTRQRIIEFTSYGHSLRMGRLTWHDGVIPQDEVWVKLGGDKGGTSVKMNFQIVNVPAPNSVRNTCVFTVFEAVDTPVNLEIALSRYKEDVVSMSSAKWAR